MTDYVKEGMRSKEIPRAEEEGKDEVEEKEWGRAPFDEEALARPRRRTVS